MNQFFKPVFTWGICMLTFGAAAEPEPLVLVDRDDLAAAVERFEAEGEGHPVFAALLGQADEALEAPLQKVTDKTEFAPSGDPHDYQSIGSYWWPNPDTPDGLPWVRRDGELNPKVYDGANSDSGRLDLMAEQVKSLALAYHLTKDERYARRAGEALRAWFLDPETAMNPHLRYAQGVPGRFEGRRYGIIEFYLAIELLDTVRLLEASDAWTDEDSLGLKDWFRQLVEWLQTSQLGLEERATSNNHAVWRVAQELAYLYYTKPGRPSEYETGRMFNRLLNQQVEADGRQPEELARTLSLSYSYFNLKAFQTIARIGQLRGLSLWTDNPRFKAALDFIAPYAVDGEGWPHPQIKPMDQSARSAMWMAAAAYGDPTYAQAARDLLEREPDEISLHDLAAVGAGRAKP